MIKWYWHQWRQRDNIELFSRLWVSHGLIGFVLVGFFLISSIAAFVAGVLQVQPLSHDVPLFGIAGMASGVAALLYAGCAMAAVANSTAERLSEIEAKLNIVTRTTRPPSRGQNERELGNGHSG